MKNIFSDRAALSHGHSDLQIKYKINLNQFMSLMKTKQEKFLQEKHEMTLFFFVGLCVSLFLVNLAFEWKFYGKDSLVTLGTLSDDNFDDLLKIPITEQPPPPPPKLQVMNIVEVSDEEIIEEEFDVDLDLEVSEETVIGEVVYNMEFEDLEEEEVEEVFTIVEQPPLPKGGIKAFYEYAQNTLKYPMRAKRMGIEGKVFVQFIVNTDGSLTDAVVIKGILGGCDEEAIRVVMNAPKWNPGKQRGKPVKVQMILPIHFMLHK